MHWNIRYETDRNYVHAWQGGRYTLEDEVRFLDEIFGSPFWRKGTPLVVDIGSMEMDNVDDGVIAIASRLVTLLNDKLGNARFALVCTDERQFEVGQQWMTSVSPHINAEVSVFRDESSAIDWATAINKVSAID